MPKKPKLGQHWLKDRPVLKSMVEAAEVDMGDVILEVGPGQGALTDKLAATGAGVMAVELDKNLADKLAKSYRDSTRIRIVHGDIRQFDLNELPSGYKVAANIPYYLTGPLIRKLTVAGNPPTLMALLVQEEVAERLAASAGAMSILGVAAQLFGTVEIKRIVPPEAFVPPPEVDSAIVAIKRKAGIDRGKIESIMAIVRHGFANRRKTLLNSLSAGFKLDKQTVAAGLKEAGLDGNVRAQDLELGDWNKLYNYFKESIDG